jgi:hypothetical protein
MNLLLDFERDCAAAEINPADALRAGGVHPTLWTKWKRGASPTLKNFEAARAGLEALRAAKQRAARRARRGKDAA